MKDTQPFLLSYYSGRTPSFPPQLSKVAFSCSFFSLCLGKSLLRVMIDICRGAIDIVQHFAELTLAQVR
jgi:hypothetical protein